MIDIIPAILARTPEEFHTAYRRLTEAGVRRIHLDIADGHFVPNTTIAGYPELMGLDDGVSWDVHLMVNDPEHRIDHWWGVPRADRFFVHVEATAMFPELNRHAAGHRAAMCPAISPETPLQKLEELCCSFPSALFMTVHPGFQGSPFIPAVLDRVRAFRAAHPDVGIVVDGGVTPDTASSCVAAGAGELVSGSFVVRSDDIPAALEELRKSAVVQ